MPAMRVIPPFNVGEESQPRFLMRTERSAIDQLTLEEKPAFSTRWFVLSDPLLEHGDNSLSITLTKSDPEAASPTIVIDEVEIFVEPR